MNQHHLIVDWDGTQPKLSAQGSLTEPEPIARLLKQLARLIGGELDPIALVSDQDSAAMNGFKQDGVTSQQRLRF